MKTTNKAAIKVTTILVSLVMASVTYASGKHHGSDKWAKVTQVEPITRLIEHSTPETSCWTEQVHYETSSGDRSYTSTIIGGIIGGAIGNAVGHKKKNKRIGTAVGAVLGASIGSDIGSSRDGRNSNSVIRSRDERRCETTRHVRYEEEVIGYDVWYRYHGETYKTRMGYNPGNRIKVRVTVKPL